MENKERLDFSKRMKSRSPEFDAAWNRFVRDVGPELVNFIHEKIPGKGSLLSDLAKFRFKFVVDTNFIFGQVKGAIQKNKDIEKSFIYKLLSSKSVQIFAPPLLQKELLEKINLLIAEENREKAVGYALLILSRIEIKDAQWVENWKHANKFIGEIDEKDVPFLALALELESHAIMTFDDVFHRQGEIKVWRHGDADKVITNYNSGFISFLIVEQSGVLLGNIVGIVLRFIMDLVLSLIELLIKIASGLVKNLTEIPWPIWVLIAGLGIAFWDELAKVGKDFLSFLKEKGSEILSKLRLLTNEIYQLLKGFLEVVGVGGTIAFEFLGYLLNEYNNMNGQLKEMDFDKGIDFTGLTTKQA